MLAQFAVLLGIAGLLIVGMLVVPRWRVRRAVHKAFPLAYSAILRRDLPQYRHLAPDLQWQLKKRIQQFLFEKTFVGCAGLEVTDQMRVLIAARACMLLLNRETEVYPGLSHILIYPSVFVVPREFRTEDGLTVESRQVLSGESWSDGRVLLAWDQVLPPEGQMPGHDVVMHEFAHQLDGEDGVEDGAPDLGSQQRYQVWSRVMRACYRRHAQMLAHGEHSTIDEYGQTNPAEFFAVSTETFFTNPHGLSAEFPDLFRLLRQFYHVDPREWAGF